MIEMEFKFSSRDGVYSDGYETEHGDDCCVDVYHGDFDRVHISTHNGAGTVEFSFSLEKLLEAIEEFKKKNRNDW